MGCGIARIGQRGLNINPLNLQMFAPGGAKKYESASGTACSIRGLLDHQFVEPSTDQMHI